MVETDVSGRTTCRRHTADGQLKELLRPADESEGAVLYERTTFEYDRNGNLVRELRHGRYWDLKGNQVKKAGKDLALSFAYDKRNRRIRAEDGTGALIRWKYDIQGKLVYEEKTISEDVRQAVHYSYDRAGRLTEIREERDSGLPRLDGEERSASTHCRYDENGNQTEIMTPEGYQVLREYDPCDRLILDRVLDKANGIDWSVRVTYDYAGNITGITRLGKGLPAWELSYRYDLKDRITHAKDCLGPVFQYQYNKNDWLKEELLPQPGAGLAHENRNQYAYDAYGQLLKTLSLGTTSKMEL